MNSVGAWDICECLGHLWVPGTFVGVWDMLTSCSFCCCSPAAACLWLMQRSVGCPVPSSVWCPACPSLPRDTFVLHMHPQHCPWVCACNSQVISLTLHVMGGDIYLPFGKAVFLGKEPRFLAECNQEDHCPENTITPVLHLHRVFRGTVPESQLVPRSTGHRECSLWPRPCPPAL